MKTLLFTTGVLSLLFIAACTISRPSQPSAQEVKEKAANATAAIKSDTKAAAEGIREGWNRDKALDLNKASKDDLLALPGITPEKADKVIASRPFTSPDQLVSRGILTSSQFEKIKTKVLVK